MRRSLAVVLLLAAGACLGLAWYDRPPVAPGAWLSAAGLEAHTATVAGRRVRYVRAGSGPAVVLVHGFGSSLYTWKDVIAPLAARHDVVALDLPGFGGSERPADLTFADFPRAVVGLVDRLGIERAALVGNSMGGATVAVVAGANPERLSALVLIAAAGFNLASRTQPATVRLLTSPLAPALGLLPGKRLIVTRTLRQVFHDDTLVTDERVAEYLAGSLAPGSFAALGSLGASLAGRPALVTDALAGVKAPTLVIWGEDDRWIPLADADRFVAAIRGARKVVIPACGHLPQEERPSEVARLLLDFLG